MTELRQSALHFCYSFSPRGKDGVDEIVRPFATCRVNGILGNAICDFDQSGTDPKHQKNDKLKVSIRTLVPLRKGDTVKLELSYEVVGQHAICREELESYLNRPDLKDNYRNKMQKKTRSEMVYAFVRHYAKCTIRVTFPDNYLWRHLDNIEDTFVISAGTRGLEKKAITQIARVSATSTCIEIRLPREVGAEHGFYVFWSVPSRKELTTTGFIQEQREFGTPPGFS